MKEGRRAEGRVVGGQPVAESAAAIESIPHPAPSRVSPDTGLQFRQDNAQQPGIPEQSQGDGGFRRTENFPQFVPYPFRREAANTLGHGAQGRQGAAFDGEFQLGCESAGPNRTQGIFGEALTRDAHRPDDFPLQIPRTVVGIQESMLNQIPCKGVHGEVAPGKIVVNVPGVGDRIGVPGVGVGPVSPEGGGFKAVIPLEDGNGSVPDARGDAASEELPYGLRRGVGGQIEVVDEPSEQGIAHGAPHQPALTAGFPEYPGDEFEFPGNGNGKSGGGCHAADGSGAGGRRSSIRYFQRRT